MSVAAESCGSSRRAVSVLAKGCSVELKPCTSKPCCCNKVHCPMCPVEMFTPTTFPETSTHLVNEHISKGVEVEANLCLLCKLPCDSEPHFHCPTCSFTSRRTHLLRRHSAKCQSVREWDNMWPVLASLQVSAGKELLDELGLEPNQQVPKPVKVFKHRSIVLRLTDLPVPRCETCCDQFHCPICPAVALKSGTPQRIAQHLITSHWKRRVSINNIQILKCTMNSCLRNPSRFGQSHYHCPLCPKVNLSANRAIEHFQCHRKGTVKKDRVESCNAPASTSPSVAFEDLAELLEAPAVTTPATPESRERITVQLGGRELQFMEVTEEDSKNDADFSTVNIQLLENETKQEPGVDEGSISSHQQTADISTLDQQDDMQPVLISLPAGNSYMLDNTAEEAGHTIHGLVLPQGTVTPDGCIMTQDSEGYVMDQTLPNQVFVVNPASGEITGHAVASNIQFQVMAENMSENATENATENVTEIASDNMTENTTDNVTERATDVELLKELNEESQDEDTEVNRDRTDSACKDISTSDITLNAEDQSDVSTIAEQHAQLDESPDPAEESTASTEKVEGSRDEESKASGNKKDFDVFDSVSAVLNKQLFQGVPNGKDLLVEALNKNFGLNCKAGLGGAVEVEGAWWQMACAHMILEEIRDKQPTTTKQLAQILHTDSQTTDEEQPGDSKVDVNTPPETRKNSENETAQPTNPLLPNTPAKKKRGRPRKNPDATTTVSPSVVRETKYRPAVVERPATRSKRRKLDDGAADHGATDNEKVDVDPVAVKLSSGVLSDETDETEDSAVKQKQLINKQRLESFKRSIVVIRPTKETLKNEQRSRSHKSGSQDFKMVSAHVDNVAEMVEADKSKPDQDQNSCETAAVQQDKATGIFDVNHSQSDQNSNDHKDMTTEEEALNDDTNDGENIEMDDEVKQDQNETLVTHSIAEKEVDSAEDNNTSITDSWDIEIKYTEDASKDPTEGSTADENTDIVDNRDESNNEGTISELINVVPECPTDLSSQDAGVIHGRVTTDVDCPEARDPAHRTCANCATTFETRPELLYHLLEAREEACRKYRLKDFPHKLRTELTTMKRVQSTTCVYCSAQFETLNDSKVHAGIRACRPKKTHNPLNLEKDSVTGLFKCPECNYMSRLPAVVVEHMELKHQEKTLPCPICKRMFSTQKHLQRHVEFIHVNKKRVTCSICGKEVMEKYLRKHIKDVHLTQETSHSLRKLPEPVFCGEAGCAYSTHYIDVLKKHKKRIHGVKDKNCDICGASFAFIGDLNAHKKIHKEIPGRSEVSCPQCEKVMMKQNLAIHMKTVHEQKRLYTCHVCNKSFTTKYVLNCHVETHKKPSDRSYKFICDYCGAGFINKTIYADHLNTHTGQRPYKCPTCGKSFRQTSVFHKHLELHSNVKYFCAPCNEMFPNKRAYSNHKSAVHMAPRLKIVRERVEEVADCGALSVEQAEAILSNHSSIQSKQILIQDAHSMMLSDGGATEIPQPDLLPAQSLVTLEDGTVVLVEGDLSQSAAEEGIVPEIVGPEGVLVTQQLEGHVVQIQEEADMIQPAVVAQEETDSGFQCGHCLQYFTKIEEIREHIITFHSEHLGESAGVHDHATGDTTHTLVLQQEEGATIAQW